ncbi:hypothetical protein BW247_09745 [Acidihalobacter ferrooxydans]|uniref:Uncharacterized protein n=1 Tax=Acidihalobacter ferrooxydans TaxID=1765967 RepID=A0A1P8UHN9_9GAMM|nr:hypothetical protein BW247_09745 [Acidihalobacter ferrooxydans]
MLRVFGMIYNDTFQESVNDSQVLTPKDREETGLLTAEIARLTAIVERQERELGSVKDEISWLCARVEAAEQRMLAGPGTKKKWWWR